MEAVNLKFEPDADQRRYHEQLVRRLKQDPEVRAFLKRSRLDESVLETDSAHFSRWLKEKAVCRNCGGLDFCTQPVRGNFRDLQKDEQGFLTALYRPCRYQQLENSQMSHRSRFSFSHLQNQDYLVSFETLGRTLDQEPKSYMLAYGRALSSVSQKEGCLFFGQPGTGKSTLMMALANEHARRGDQVSYVRVPLLIAQLKENLHDDEFRRLTLLRLRQSQVLFLDDFGSESVTPWSRDEILFPILDERMNNRRKTYFASNIQHQELEKRYLLDGSISNTVASLRLMDRIRTLARPVELMGLSRRKSPV